MEANPRAVAVQTYGPDGFSLRIAVYGREVAAHPRARGLRCLECLCCRAWAVRASSRVEHIRTRLICVHTLPSTRRGHEHYQHNETTQVEHG